MTERPILFSAPMVRALLAGQKSQTRRIIKPAWRGREILNLAEHGESRSDPARRRSGRFDDPASWGYPCAEDGVDMDLASWPDLCPYGRAGDRLWVRETWWCYDQQAFDAREREGVVYRADQSDEDLREERRIVKRKEDHWRPSIFMPRWASRVTLEVANVRVERVDAISEADAIAEGVAPEDHEEPPESGYEFNYRAAFLRLFYDLNERAPRGANPWVWVVEFRPIA